MEEIYIPGGYIMLSRKIIESEIWDKPPLYLKVWIYILTKARHEKTKDYERGELLISIPELQEACTHKIGFRKETPTKKQIFTILEWLRNPHEGAHDGNDEKDTKATMIGTTKTTRGLIVKVHNYNVYQSSKNYERNNEGNDESSSKEMMEGERREREGNTIHKNVKNEKNVTNNNSATNVANEREEQLLNEFNDWWNLYNKKKDKKVALSKFKVARKKHSLETIVKGTESYLKTVTNKQYQKHPKTFLNNETFLDEFDEHEKTQINKTDSHSSFDAIDYLADME